MLFLLITLTVYRWAFFKLRKLYRREGGNFVRVVVIGEDSNLDRINSIFGEPDFGYRYLGFFDNKSSGTSEKYLGIKIVLNT